MTPGIGTPVVVPSALASVDESPDGSRHAIVLVKSLPIAVALWLIALPVAAHHSSAIFDRERDLRLEGVITKFEWANPHVYLHVETRNDAGESVVWVIEAGAPGFMTRLGWSARSLAPGDRVIVAANPAKNPDRKMALGSFVLKGDGTLLSIRGSSIPPALAAEDPPTPLIANNLSGRWLTRWNPDVPLFQPRQSWPLTTRGRIAMEQSDASGDPSGECIPQTVPLLMAWPDVKSIEVGEKVTVIRYERDGERTVYMNVASHQGALPSHQGHSIGRWEGNVLVVDTTHFAAHRNGHGWGLPSGQQKHLVERFELNPTRTAFRYTFQIDDSEYLVRSVTGTLEFIYRPDLPMVIVPCDPDVARRGFEK